MRCRAENPILFAGGLRQQVRNRRRPAVVRRFQERPLPPQPTQRLRLRKWAIQREKEDLRTADLGEPRPLTEGQSADLRAIVCEKNVFVYESPGSLTGDFILRERHLQIY